MEDEFLDVIDDQNSIIGQEMRSIVHQLGLQHRGVHVFLFTRSGKLIVQMRSRDRKACPSSLDCSLSEHVRSGEDFLDAAIRGLKEELGLDEINLQTIVTFKMKYGPNDNEISRLYRGAAELSQIHFDPIEVESVTEYSLPELISQTSVNDIVLSDWFKQILFWVHNQPSGLQVMEIHDRLKF